MKCRNRRCNAEIDDGFKFCPMCGKPQEPQKRRSCRRANKTGSVYKRSDLKNRPWVAVTPSEWDEEGNRSNQTIGYFATQQEAVEALDEYRKNPTTKLNVTVQEIFDEWSAVSYKDISPQTQANYNAAWKRLTKIADIKMRELRTGDMQSCIDAASEMSASSLSKIKILLTQLCDYSMQNDIVNKNYAKFIKLPKKEKTVKDCFTDLELKKIENAVGVVPWADVILMMCYTGFRVSEFLELTAHAYDAKNNTLTGGLKTEAGKNRIVPVHHKILPILKQWIAKKGDTIICKDNGKSMDAHYFRKHKFYPALEAIGVRKLTPHATRHTFATRLAACGVDTKHIQQLCGHEDYALTANVYTHPDTAGLAKSIEQMS